MAPVKKKKNTLQLVVVAYTSKIATWDASGRSLPLNLVMLAYNGCKDKESKHWKQ